MNFPQQHYANPFFFNDGTLVADLPSLLAKLRTLSYNSFYLHVNDHKNDFAHWIEDSIQEYELARVLYPIRNKDQFISALQNYIDHVHEDIIQPMQATTKPRIEMQQRSFTPKVPRQRETPASTYKKPQSQVSKYPGQDFDFELDTSSQPEVHSQAHEDPTHHEFSLDTSSNHVGSSRNFEPKQPIQTKPVEVASTKKPEFEGYPKEPKVSESANVPKTMDSIIKPQVQDVPKQHQQYAVTQQDSAPQDILPEDKVHEYQDVLLKMRKEISKVFIGQDETVHMILLALICESHVLIEGVPGLAKSVLVEVMSLTVEGTHYSRIQFLPDMLPADVVGGQIYNPKTNEFKTIKGPIFGNFILADEINRAPPKTHAALMEAMAERKINIDKDEFKLDPPFLVMATQNPLENKGTYSLPEAVLDRFMFKVNMDYPERKHEKVIITRNNNTRPELRSTVQTVVTKDQVKEMQHNIKQVYISNKIKDYIMDIIEATRGQNKKIEGIKFVKYGAGPRASIAFGVAAQAEAMLHGRNYVLPSDVQAIAKPILRHRLALNFKGKAYNISSDKIVDEILSKIEIM